MKLLLSARSAKLSCLAHHNPIKSFPSSRSRVNGSSKTLSGRPGSACHTELLGHQTVSFGQNMGESRLEFVNLSGLE
jgi:hypothetical protein